MFVRTDSTEIFFSKPRSAGLNYNLPTIFSTLTVRGLSNKHCLLTFFIGPDPDSTDFKTFQQMTVAVIKN